MQCLASHLQFGKVYVLERIIEGKEFEMTKIYHVSNGKAYGPSEPGETLAQYKARVRKAYGNLNGVKFGKREDFHPACFW